MQKKCIICNNDYIAKIHNSKFCSKACKNIIDRKNALKSYYKRKENILKDKREKYAKIRGILPDKNCIICNKLFSPNNKIKVICSKECELEKRRKQCRESHYRNRQTRNEYKRNRYQNNRETILHLANQYYHENKEELLSKKRKKYQDNIEEEREKDKIYRSKIKDKIRIWNKKQYLKNPEYYKEYSKKYQPRANELRRKRRIKDLNFKLREQLRSRIRGAIKDQWGMKSKKTLDLLGCSIEKIKSHLEKQFKEGMSWDNYGFKGWHIDHIKPCVSFDLTKPEEQMKCFHYTNLQPLWWWENLSKSGKSIPPIGIPPSI